jgi:prevent-host-death family protein
VIHPAPRVSISEARRRLSQLVRQVTRDRGSVVQVTVRGEVVAELRAAPRSALPEPEPGAAARALLELMRSLPKPRPRRGRPRDVSAHATEYLYGRRR